MSIDLDVVMGHTLSEEMFPDLVDRLNADLRMRDSAERLLTAR
jgi:hypothetical protein